MPYKDPAKNAEKKREWTKNNPNYMRQWHLKTTYNITVEDWNKMFEEQKGCCKICGIHQSNTSCFHTDHDHITGEVRGLLCQKCNHMLGLVNDDVSILEKAIKYLKKHKEN